MSLILLVRAIAEILPVGFVINVSTVFFHQTVTVGYCVTVSYFFQYFDAVDWVT